MPQIENERSHENTFTNVHGTYFTTAESLKDPKRPSTDEQNSKTWSSHTMEYYAAVKSIEY